MKKLYIFLACTLLVSGVFAQGKKNPYAKRGNNNFLKTQWWLGFHAGGNFTNATNDAAYSTFAPINYESSTIAKEYGKRLPGGQAGITVAFFHHGFSFVFEPMFRTQQFDYQNTYNWASELNPENNLELRYTHTQTLQYAEIPVYLRYDILRGKLRPYVQIGGFYGHLLNAKKTVETSGQDLASGTAGNFQDQEITFGATDLFVKNNYGVTGGVGVSYDVWNVRFVLGANYRYGLANITNGENRFAMNPVADTGDVMDDITISSIDISLSCVFPLRFISKNLKSLE